MVGRFRAGGPHSKLRWFYHNTCLRKSMLTKEQADKRLELAPIGDHGGLLYYYECPFCAAFHMTKVQPNPELTMYQYRQFVKYLGVPNGRRLPEIPAEAGDEKNEVEDYEEAACQ